MSRWMKHHGFKYQIFWTFWPLVLFEKGDFWGDGVCVEYIVCIGPLQMRWFK